MATQVKYSLNIPIYNLNVCSCVSFYRYKSRGTSGDRVRNFFCVLKCKSTGSYLGQKTHKQIPSFPFFRFLQPPPYFVEHVPLEKQNVVKDFLFIYNVFDISYLYAPRPQHQYDGLFVDHGLGDDAALSAHLHLHLDLQRQHPDPIRQHW